MRLTSTLMLALAGCLSHQAAAAVDCDGNITISNADEASKVAKACSTIGGDLTFGDVSKDINLDGIESVMGTITYNGCGKTFKPCDKKNSSPFSISSSTLKSVNGSIDIYNFKGLDKLLLPKLQVVYGEFNLDESYNLTHLDISDLERVGSFSMTAEALERLDLDGLQGFTPYLSPDVLLGVATPESTVRINAAGTIKSLDGFFKNALQPPDENFDMNIYVDRVPKVRKLTVGWPKIDVLSLFGRDDIVVTLGGPDTESMDINIMFIGTDLNANGTGVLLHRGSQLQSLTAGDAFIDDIGPIHKFVTFFDDVETVAITDGKLKSVELPAEAEHWGTVALNLHTPLVALKEFDDDEKKIWHWPPSMPHLVLTARLENDFFDSFFKQNSTIPELIQISDQSGRFDCSAFKKKFGLNIPEEFECESHDNTPPGYSSDDDSDNEDSGDDNSDDDNSDDDDSDNEDSGDDNSDDDNSDDDNSDDDNSDDDNSDDKDSGDKDSGDKDSGDEDSGDKDSGDDDSGDDESGDDGSADDGSADGASAGDDDDESAGSSTGMWPFQLQMVVATAFAIVVV